MNTRVNAFGPDDPGYFPNDFHNDGSGESGDSVTADSSGDGSATIPIDNPIVPEPDQAGKKAHVAVIAGTVSGGVGTFVIVFVIFVVLLFVRRKRKRHYISLEVNTI